MTLRPMDDPHAAETPTTPNADRFLAAVAVDGEVVFAGPSVPSVLGVDRERLVGDDFVDRVHPNDQSAVSDALSAVAVERQAVHRIQHANGGYIWVESVVDDDLAPQFGGRVVTSRRVDIDGTFPERFRAFLEYGTDIVTVVDEDGRVRYESPSVEEVLGYEQGSLVGQSPLGYVHSADRDRVTEEFYRVLAEPETESTLEYRYRTADGDWVWLESRTRSLPNDAAVGHLVINSRDITERKRRERRLTDRNERLDQFSSIVSHDLRNPLSVVRASIEMAQHKDDTEPLERGERAVDRIERLATELLTLARQGNGIDDPAEFRLEGVAREAWDTVGTEKADLVVGQDAEICGDRSRLRQALENLFRNCVEHGGSEDLIVVVTATDRGFVVADDGPGIDPDHKPEVFESGFTTQEDGTGYGLDIVRGIVEAHDWNIALTDFETVTRDAVDCPTPDGACFEIRAPTREDVIPATPDSGPADGNQKLTWIDR